VTSPREIWVFPEINGTAQNISKLSFGLLTDARCIAEKIGGKVTALLFGDQGEGYPLILKQYGIAGAYVFKHALLHDFSAEIAALILAEKARIEKPWLILMGNTTAGKELSPRLAALLDTGVVANCVKINLDDPGKVVFYRPILGEQAYQECTFQDDRIMLATIDSRVLNITPVKVGVEPKIMVITPNLENFPIKIRHQAYLQADFKTVDVTDADIVVSAGAGAVSDDLLPLVKELASLVEGTLGTTRPVVDEGKIERERMIGQTGKTVSPDLYLALGISGATHHLGGIQESGTIIAINRDPQAQIFNNADAGAVADLRDVLPKLIEKIKKSKKDA
jgi:electron transfer flavoprotein alpha subunit